nr:filamentous hemagglutinin [Xenococcus sp. MO_188.B8]
GKVGNIFIEAREVSLTDTSQLQAGVFTGGKGEAAGIVSINASDSISFTGTNTGIFSNVESQAMGDGSDIQLSAPSIFLDDGAVLSADNAGVGDAGNVNINANTVSFDGSSATSRVGTTGIGNAGAISINTSNLTLINGAQIGSSTFGQGNAGSVTINATDAISLDGENRDGVVSLISSSVESGAVGNAGIVSINTRNLTLTNGAQILSATFGKGNAGNVTINATDTVSLDGEAKNGANSTISSSVQPEAVGNGGDVNIDTSNLFLTNGAQIDSGTFGEGNAGNVTIKATGVVSLDGEGKDGFDSGIASSVSSSAVGNGGNISIDAKNLSLTNGAFVSSDTSGEGDAGSLTVRASESVELSGVSAGGRSRLLANAIQGSGNGGDLTVFTDELIVRDGAIISVSNFPGIEGLEPGTGEAGNVRIEANSLRLENGQINAATESGAGGNITLQIADNLILEDNSLISARANNNANGGNIDIDAEFIVAFPSQFDGNDILASAQQGQGGNINITAEALLGIKERPQNPLTNDIDASSEFGLDGSVSIFTPDVNTLQKDTEIPNNLVESETLGANACSGRGATEAASSFTVKGKGGLPPIPTKPFMADLLIPDGKPITLDKKSDLTSLLEEESETEPENPNYIPEYIKPIKTSRGDIYPARGIIKTEDGRVILTTYPTDNINTRTPHIATNCSLVKDEQQ